VNSVSFRLLAAVAFLSIAAANSPAAAASIPGAAAAKVVRAERVMLGGAGFSDIAGRADIRIGDRHVQRSRAGNSDCPRPVTGAPPRGPCRTELVEFE
jgi:hypothetical protein